MKRIKSRPVFEKTDDGGVNWKYNYAWEVDCEREGTVREIIEGTANMCRVPTCSLWGNKF